MSREVWYTETADTQYLGRNGVAKQVGLNALSMRACVILTPINRNRQLGRCWLEIPAGAIGDVVDMLRQAARDLQKKRAAR